MKDFTKGIAALLFAMLACGSFIFGGAVFTWIQDTTIYPGYDYDRDGDYYSEHEEMVLNRMNTGLALVCGAAFGLGILNSKKDTSEKENVADQQTINEIPSKPDNMVECAICKTKNHKDNMFCEFCGSKLHE